MLHIHLQRALQSSWRYAIVFSTANQNVSGSIHRRWVLTKEVFRNNSSHVNIIMWCYFVHFAECAASLEGRRPCLRSETSCWTFSRALASYREWKNCVQKIRGVSKNVDNTWRVFKQKCANKIASWTTMQVMLFQSSVNKYNSALYQSETQQWHAL